MLTTSTFTNRLRYGSIPSQPFLLEHAYRPPRVRTLSRVSLAVSTCVAFPSKSLSFPLRQSDVSWRGSSSKRTPFPPHNRPSSTTSYPVRQYSTNMAKVMPLQSRLVPSELLANSMEKPQLDNRSYRVVKLPNQLEALLMHDPDTDKASAAMDVNVGSFSDTADMPGIAHAVEHLLFMGTEKVRAYPHVGEDLADCSSSRSRTNTARTYRSMEAIPMLSPLPATPTTTLSFLHHQRRQTAKPRQYRAKRISPYPRLHHLSMERWIDSPNSSSIHCSLKTR